MSLRGAAIGPDAVLVWTGERELTRFDKRGARSSFTISVPPLASQIGRAGVRIVDAHGTIHRYALTGQHEGAVPLRAPLEGSIEAAALAAESDELALVISTAPSNYGDRYALTDVFANGARLDWNLRRRLDGYCETGVALSQDGRWLMITYETYTYFTGFGSAGDNGEGVNVMDSDGALRFEQYDYRSRLHGTTLSHDGNWLAWCEVWGEHVYVRVEGVGIDEWSVDALGRGAKITFAADHIGVLYEEPSQIAIAELSTRRQAQLELPEQFHELVFCGEDLVVVHPELGAWWIPLASLRFKDAD